MIINNVFKVIKKWVWDIPREQSRVEREQKLIKAEQAAIKVEQDELGTNNLPCEELLKRMGALDRRTEALNHWIQGLNVRVGDLNEMTYGSGKRAGFGKDGTRHGKLPGQ